jgi:small ligand-binding sensory domain FIST
MQFAAAITRCENVPDAVAHLVASLRRQMTGEIDLLVLFLTPEYQDEAQQLSRALRLALSPGVLLGCTCEGVIGGDREIEREPAISVLAARLPGVTLTPFHIGMEEWESLLDANNASKLKRILALTPGDGEPTRAYIVLADPFTSPIMELMQSLDDLTPHAPTLGGMCSGAQQAGQNLLFLNGQILEDGAIGVRIAGPVQVDTIVSQGCRPIGDTMLITGADGNRISSLSGRSALDATRELLEALPEADKELLSNGLFLGVVVNEYQSSFGRGDFLIRPVFGADPETGAIAVGDTVRAGQTVQYHVRDARTADEELRELMQQAAQEEVAPAGGLLFSCNGRGVRLFDMPNHDVRGVLEAVPETPLAGFFAQGEFGPIGGRSFLHGHTLSVALFRPVRQDESGLP